MPKPLFKSEAKFEVIDMKMISYCHANETHFHNNGFALRLVIQVRVSRSRKWPIATSGVAEARVHNSRKWEYMEKGPSEDEIEQ